MHYVGSHLRSVYKCLKRWYHVPSRQSVLLLQVRDIVLVHIVPQRLEFADLLEIPEDESTATLLDGNSLKLSQAGAISGSNAGEVGSGSIGLEDANLDACANNSSMHTVKALLPIANFELPESAAPRTVEVSWRYFSEHVQLPGWTCVVYCQVKHVGIAQHLRPN